jgi:HAD superfamily hydrolase (TIGR01484 family)
MKFLATDLDRTLIPNGSKKGGLQAIASLKSLLSRHHVGLVFVTGRPLFLVKQAIRKYHLPFPRFIISDVGTSLYEFDGVDDFLLVGEWGDRISRLNPSFVSSVIDDKVLSIPGVSSQASRYQSSFKRSFLVKDRRREKVILRRIRHALKNIPFTLVTSRDSRRKVLFVDILPLKVSKLFALNFLVGSYGIRKGNVVFSGDSGNDVELLCSSYKGILVGNASDEVRSMLKPSKSLFFASESYAEGIIEGCYHFGFFS